MGGMRYSDHKKFVEFLNKGNADNFYKLMKIFYQELIVEWVAGGNEAQYFTKKVPKIVIIFDNASFHNTQNYQGPNRNRNDQYSLRISPRI